MSEIYREKLFPTLIRVISGILLAFICLCTAIVEALNKKELFNIVIIGIIYIFYIYNSIKNIRRFR